MTLDLDKFRFKDGAMPLSAEEFNARFFALVRRLHVLEQLKVSWEGVVAETTNYGLIRINEAVKPLVDELAADMQALLDEGQAVIDAVSVHAERQDNPHLVTVEQIGAEIAGAAASAVSGHEGLYDHPAFAAHLAALAMHVPDATGAGADDVLTPAGWRAFSQYPVGATFIWRSDTPPPFGLENDGAAISRTVYADVFAVLGTRYGAGDGSTTFNLPDDRGVGLRGWDNGRGLDPGRDFGSYQNDALEDHKHCDGVWPSRATGAQYGYSETFNVDGYNADGALSRPRSFTSYVQGTSKLANENRMKNNAVMFCTKI